MGPNQGKARGKARAAGASDSGFELASRAESLLPGILLVEFGRQKASESKPCSGSLTLPDSVMLEESIPYMIEPLGKWKQKDRGWADKERT